MISAGVKLLKSLPKEAKMILKLWRKGGTKVVKGCLWTLIFYQMKIVSSASRLCSFEVIIFFFH